MRRILYGLASMAAVGALVACTGQAAPPTGGDAVTIVDLPAPRTDGSFSLEEVLGERRSVRAFTGEALELAELGQLLWATQGITAEWGGRTAPSAGALYPLEVYVATPDGLYHYLPEGHRAERLSGADLRTELADAAYEQTAVRDAPAVFVIAGVYERTAVRYGGRAERYVHLEVGHAAQNLLLQAVALGLGGVPVGAFTDDTVTRVLGLPSDQAPPYLVPVGHPAG